MNMIFYAANGHGYCAYSFDNFFDTDKNLLQILVPHSDACTRHMKSNIYCFYYFSNIIHSQKTNKLKDFE